MRSVITYLRYSSATQGTGDADSSRRQNELFKQWLKRNNDAAVIASYKDEGHSAFKGKHLAKQFGAMLERIEADEFPEGTILLCEAIDRIGRLEHLETESLMNRILEHGIEIHTLADSIIYTKEILSSDLGVSLIQRVKSYLAHQESKQKSFRVSQKWEQRAKLALEGTQQLTKMVPGWIDPDTLKLNEHAQTVKTIFELLLAGESLHNITRHLQSNEIKSFSRRKDANGFSVHSVRTILTSESTVGTLAASKHNNRPAIPNYYAGAVDVSTFNKAQEILSKNRKGRTPASDNPITINLFKGLIRCECGASVHPTGVKKTYQGVYRCNNKVDGRCDVPHISRKPFDKWIIENLVGMIEQDNNDDKEKRKDELEYQIELLSKQIKKATILLVTMDDVPEIQEQVTDLNQQRKSKQSELETLNHQESLSDKALPHLADLDLMTKEGRVEAQLLLSKYVQCIELKRDMIIITLRNGCTIGQSRDLKPTLSRKLMQAVITSTDGKGIGLYEKLSSDEEFRKSGRRLTKRG